MDRQNPLEFTPCYKKPNKETFFAICVSESSYEFVPH